jgi:hypothetical protein
MSECKHGVNRIDPCPDCITESLKKEIDYGEYSDETTVIEAFEIYTEELLKEKMVVIGRRWEDIEEWFLCFRAGFIAGGNN